MDTENWRKEFSNAISIVLAVSISFITCSLIHKRPLELYLPALNIRTNSFSDVKLIENWFAKHQLGIGVHSDNSQFDVSFVWSFGTDTLLCLCSPLLDILSFCLAFTVLCLYLHIVSKFTYSFILTVEMISWLLLLQNQIN